MRTVILLVAILMVTSLGAKADERCDEPTIRRLGSQPVGSIAAPDIYFNTRAGQPAVVGHEQMEALRKTHAKERANVKPYVFTPLQVVTNPDGTMAYDDGVAHIEFDDAASGRHMSYDITYLRVWRLIDGRCLLAAAYSRPVD